MQLTLAARSASAGYLFSPLGDFLLCGGGSLILLLVAGYFPANTITTFSGPVLAAVPLAMVINLPHFAYSYQLLYRNFRRKLGDTALPPELRRGYLLNGVIVPALLAGALLTAFLWSDATLMGLMVNAMFLTVGWHYVKQGYGILIVLSLYRQSYFSPWEKRILLANSYAVWAATWLISNYLIWDTARNYYGIYYYALPIPFSLAAAGTLVALLTTLATLALFIRRAFNRTQPFSVNGFLCYFITLYFWLFYLSGFAHPLLGVWIPAFHSLQYQAIVWRMQLNEQGTRQVNSLRALLDTPFIHFTGAGIIFGWLAFQHIPAILDDTVPYDHTLFGPMIFVCSFSIFINIHHYFIDHILWRKENPETARYLFGKPS